MPHPAPHPSRRQVLAWGATALAAAGLAGCATRPPLAAPLATADALRWANRLTYGADAATLQRLQQLGTAGFVREQLDPATPAGLPADVAQVLAASEPQLLLDVLGEIRGLQDTVRKLADGSPERIAAAQQVQQRYQQLSQAAFNRSTLRALYSQRQVEEQMVAFWLNHFSVFQYKGALRAMVGDYEERAIRPHAMGDFRALLLASMAHPAMLQYLDNAQSTAGKINENYARELLELHTLGVDGGYSQQDVQEAARALTGAGIAGAATPPRIKAELMPAFVRRDAFEFNPQRHDFGSKTVLGRPLAGQGMAELEQLADLLARHPSTAAYVSRKLAVYWTGDAPSDALVQRLAARFTSSNGHIPSVLATLFASSEFEASLGRQFRDPRQYLLASLRLAHDGQVIRNTRPLFGLLASLGQQPFNRLTPDGYGMREADWSSSGQMSKRFEVARTLGSSSAGLFDGSAAPATPSSPPQLAGAVYAQAIGPSLSEPTRRVLERAGSPAEWNTLLLSSPEWMRR